MMASNLFWLENERKLKEGLDAMQFNRDNFQSLLDQLQILTRLTVEDDFRSSIPEQVLCLLLKIIQRPVHIQLFVECVRILRNCSGQNWARFPEVWSQLLDECIQLLTTFLLKEPQEADIILPRVILQFLGNVLNTQPSLSSLLWDKLQCQFGELISHEDEKIQLYGSSVIYGVLRNSPVIIEEITTLKWKDLTHKVIQSSHQGILFSQFSIQLYIKDHTLLKKLYEIHELDARLLLLHQISDFVSDCEVDVRNWKFFSQLFQERASIILRTCESPTMDLEAMEVTGFVEILAKNSSGNVCHKELALDDDLLVVTIDLLRSIHSLGQAGSNYFTAIDDHFGAVEPHPALNFKCNLVRLLGNLCYQNLTAQNRVRELEAIAPLLECCNLDARNPFIQQWSVLAIRNLCEKNLLNQEVISSMTRRGLVQPTILENLGLEIEESASGLAVRRSSVEKS